MKIQDIINETTSAGGIATVIAPMGVISRRKKPKKTKTTEQRTVDEKPVPKAS